MFRQSQKLDSTKRRSGKEVESPEEPGTGKTAAFGEVVSGFKTGLKADAPPKTAKPEGEAAASTGGVIQPSAALAATLTSAKSKSKITPYSGEGVVEPRSRPGKISRNTGSVQISTPVSSHSTTGTKTPLPGSFGKPSLCLDQTVGSREAVPVELFAEAASPASAQPGPSSAPVPAVPASDIHRARWSPDAAPPQQIRESIGRVAADAVENLVGRATRVKAASPSIIGGAKADTSEETRYRTSLADGRRERDPFHASVAAMFGGRSAASADHLDRLTAGLEVARVRGGMPYARAMVMAQSAASLFPRDPARAADAVAAIAGGALTLDRYDTVERVRDPSTRDAWLLGGQLAGHGAGWGGLQSVMDRGRAPPTAREDVLRRRCLYGSLKAHYTVRTGEAGDRQRGASTEMMSLIPLPNGPGRAGNTPDEIGATDETAFAKRVIVASREVWMNSANPSRVSAADKEYWAAGVLGVKTEEEWRSAESTFEVGANRMASAENSSSVDSYALNPTVSPAVVAGVTAEQVLSGTSVIAEGLGPSYYRAMVQHGAAGAHLPYLEEIHAEQDQAAKMAATFLRNGLSERHSSGMRLTVEQDVKLRFIELMLTEFLAKGEEPGSGPQTRLSNTKLDSGSTLSFGRFEDLKARAGRDVADGGGPAASDDAIPKSLLKGDILKFLPAALGEVRQTFSGASVGDDDRLAPGNLDKVKVKIDRALHIQNGDELKPSSGSIDDLSKFRGDIIKKMQMGGRVNFFAESAAGLNNLRVSFSNTAVPVVSGGVEGNLNLSIVNSSGVNLGGFGGEITFAHDLRTSLGGGGFLSLSTSGLLSPSVVGLSVTGAGRGTVTTSSPRGWSLRSERRTTPDGGKIQVYLDDAPSGDRIAGQEVRDDDPVAWKGCARSKQTIEEMDVEIEADVYTEGPHAGKRVSEDDPVAIRGVERTDDYRAGLLKINRMLAAHAKGDNISPSGERLTFIQKYAAEMIDDPQLSLVRQDHEAGNTSRSLIATGSVRPPDFGDNDTIGFNVSYIYRSDVRTYVSRSDQSDGLQRAITQRGEGSGHALTSTITLGLPSVGIAEHGGGEVRMGFSPVVLAGAQAGVNDRGVLATERFLKKEGINDVMQAYADHEVHSFSQMKDLHASASQTFDPMLGPKNMAELRGYIERHLGQNVRHTLRYHLSPIVTEMADWADGMAQAIMAGAKTPQEVQGAERRVELFKKDLLDALNDFKNYCPQGTFGVMNVANSTRGGLEQAVRGDTNYGVSADYEVYWMGQNSLKTIQFMLENSDDLRAWKGIYGAPSTTRGEGADAPEGANEGGVEI